MFWSWLVIVYVKSFSHLQKNPLDQINGDMAAIACQKARRKWSLSAFLVLAAHLHASQRLLFKSICSTCGESSTGPGRQEQFNPHTYEIAILRSDTMGEKSTCVKISYVECSQDVYTKAGSSYSDGISWLTKLTEHWKSYCKCYSMQPFFRLPLTGCHDSHERLS